MQPMIIKAENLKETLSPERCYIFDNYGFSRGDSQISIARARVEPGVSTIAHHLEDTQEIYLITKGEGKVHLGGIEPAEVCHGDVVVIPPGASQKITNIGKVDLIFYCICMPSFVQENYRSDENQG
jgi:mannose-6-phosphate isomerase-like protein (cupin superfamily)